MGLRLFRRFRVLPGVILNLSKTGASVSLGERGAHVTVGTSGTTETVGLPETGLFYTQHQGRFRGRGRRNAAPAANPLWFIVPFFGTWLVLIVLALMFG
jgi:hypothetical protein